MNAAELIEKLKKLDPRTPILVDDFGCGCCQGSRGEGVLVHDPETGEVVLVHPREVGQ